HYEMLLNAPSPKFSGKSAVYSYARPEWNMPPAMLFPQIRMCWIRPGGAILAIELIRKAIFAP
ncbi:MAG: hypothetical protein ACO2ZX_03045, partial [Paracoccaceae bacterium]